MKRMTLLARKDGLSTSDFRNYWAGPHAKLAMGMAGIQKYVHNRVDKVLWSSTAEPAFHVDGVVELYFSDDEAMRLAQASAVGRKYIPEDEPLFLKGWTLCVVEPQGAEPAERKTKVLVPFHAAPEVRGALWRELFELATRTGQSVMLNWTSSTACRERLWAEPSPPAGFVVLWFDTVAQAHEAFEADSALRRLFEAEVQHATAYLIDELTIR